MTRLDILSALDQFKKLTGHDPTGKELNRIKQAVIAVPITTPYDDYVKYWEVEVAGVSRPTTAPTP